MSNSVKHNSVSVINQKEYLKKYLNFGKDKDKKKKKKKKAKKTTQNRVKIIDDNIDVINNEVLTQNELDEILTQEDAPQVVGVIDDRPLALRLDDYRKSSKWKLVGSDDEEANNKLKNPNQTSKQYKSKYDSDESPPHSSRYSESPTNRSGKRNISSDSDASPPRKKNYDPDVSPPRRKNYDSDPSPPRRNKYTNEKTSPQRKIKSKKHSNSDSSLPRRRRSPDLSPKRKNCDSDISPSRKRRYSDSSPPRKDNKSDVSKERHKKSRWASPEKSSPRNKYNSRPNRSRWGDKSPQRKKSDSDTSPPRKHSKDSASSSKYSKSNDYSEPSTSKKMEKTLDGKTAGLQNARDLKHETLAFKKCEDDMFKKMSADVSGKNAAPVIRDRRTGKKRDFEKEAEEEFAKLKRQKEQKEKYDLWGKGVKQVENLREKIESDIHEMNKPLARYADDEDLEKHLREQDREGDPMLAYIRKKRKQKDIVEGKPMKPVYEGEFMPNRFGVPPGHRWDGVDRSNGYEKQWFDKQNARKAMEEEIYKWSTGDM